MAVTQRFSLALLFALSVTFLLAGCRSLAPAPDGLLLKNITVVDVITGDTLGSRHVAVQPDSRGPAKGSVGMFRPFTRKQ